MNIPWWGYVAGGAKLGMDAANEGINLYKSIRDIRERNANQEGLNGILQDYSRATGPEDVNFIRQTTPSYGITDPASLDYAYKRGDEVLKNYEADTAKKALPSAFKEFQTIKTANPDLPPGAVFARMSPDNASLLATTFKGGMDDLIKSYEIGMKDYQTEKQNQRDREASTNLDYIYREKNPLDQYKRLAEVADVTGASANWVNKQADDLRSYSKPSRDFATIDAGDKTIVRYYDGRPDEVIKKGISPNVVFKVNNGGQSTLAGGSDIEQLAQSIAAGNLDPAAISKRGNLQARVFARVNEISPGFSFNRASANAKFARSDNINRSLKLLDSVDPMLGELQTAHSDLGLTKYPAVNKAKIFALQQVGDPRVTAFNNLRNNIVLEVTNAMQGSSQMSDARVKMEAENLMNSQSPAQMRAAIANIRKIIGARTEAFGSNPWPRSKAGQAPTQNRPALSDIFK